MEEEVKIFKALSDETRLKIIRSLLDGEKCVCDLVISAKRSQPTVSIHLAKLANLGILSSRREGKSIYYRIKNEKVIEILRCMDKNNE